MKPVLDPQDLLNHNAMIILGCILEARDAGEPPPNHRELAKVAGIRSLNGVNYHLRRLRRLGLIEWNDGDARTLRPTCKLLIP